MKGERLKILEGDEQNEVIVRHLKTSRADGNSLSIVEAGCGRRCPFKLDGVAYKLVGIDIDR